MGYTFVTEYNFDLSTKSTRYYINSWIYWGLHVYEIYNIMKLYVVWPSSEKSPAKNC